MFGLWLSYFHLCVHLVADSTFGKAAASLRARHVVVAKMKGVYEKAAASLRARHILVLLKLSCVRRSNPFETLLYAIDLRIDNLP